MSWASGDFTGDGTVDINDLTIVLANYNKSVGASAGGLAAVPEPSALLLLAAWPWPACWPMPGEAEVATASEGSKVQGPKLRFGHWTLANRGHFGGS